MMYLAASVALLMNSGVTPLSDGLALLGTKDNPTGVAVQIDKEHLFLVASNLVPTETATAYCAKGDHYTVRVVARDDITQLSLVRIENWPSQSSRVFQVASEKVVATTKLAAQLPSGIVPGQLVSMDRTGVLMGSRRYVRLWEVRFESTDQKLGGAPVFTVDGRLAGIMNATLQPYGEVITAKIPLDAPPRFGPKGMTVGYALGPKVLSRVVEGFLNEDRTPLHPTVGMYFRKATGGGVELTSITQGSAAARAGLKVGDVLTKLDNEVIKDAYWLAARLFESEIGESLQFQMRRDERVSSIKIIVESLSEARQNREIGPRLTTLAPNH
ncbi:MAG: serine protease [Fimbriimonadaceae bacterium]|nr:serine protease [Fimbriimonadaceae bacterium]